MRRPVLPIAVLALVLPVTAQGQEAQEESQEPGTLVVAQWKCDWNHVETLVQRYDSLSVPINQELVNEGMLAAAGMLTHDWGDEWNVSFWWLAADKEAFFKAWAEGGRRFNERHPNPPQDPTFTEACAEHKDTIYNYGPHTTPPSQ